MVFAHIVTKMYTLVAMLSSHLHRLQEPPSSSALLTVYAELKPETAIQYE